MPHRDRRFPPLNLPPALRLVASALLLAVLAACQTTPTAPGGPGNVSRLPPGNSERDGPEARPPPNLEAVPDAVPQIEPVRPGGPNKPYEIGGHTYVPLTDDRALAEKGLASWYGKKFHGHRTASGEAYNMYAMTAAHKTLPIPSYARVRNPANGKEIIVRVNDRGPFSPGRVIDLSYTAALKLGVLNGVAQVEITRITQDDIRTGAAFGKPATMAADKPAVVVVGDLDRPVATTRTKRGALAATPPPTPLQPSDVSPHGVDAGPVGAPPSVASASGADVGMAAAVDAASPGPGTATTVSQTLAVASPRAPDKPDERTHADTTAGIGWWIQLGAFKQRGGALDFQRRLIDEQPWLAPLLAVIDDRGLSKLQAGPYVTRDDARSAAERVRTALQLVPTLVEKR
ncbi:MAG: septal ring lytic transglycosylase RlpA family protein [Vitreoscilla sp.]